jgi:hypothetical protein
VDRKPKALEAAFTVAFSVLVFLFFFSLLGANGLVLGNDPAVHLQTAQYFLAIGRIPLSDISWYTPVYHLALDGFISFTGITDVGQLIILLKAVTALIDWLLVFCVYVVSSKFLGKQTGVFAASFMLLCLPLIELNSWGGYTTILSLVFMVLSLMYLSMPLKSIGNTLIAFILAFSLVLSHQLATFLAVFIVPPFILMVLIKSRGNFSKALIAAVLGGAIAFLIYYVKPILPYLGSLVYIIFFQLTVYLYQLAFVTFDAFMVYFGFALFFAFAGLVLVFFTLRKRKETNFYILLVLMFFVPLILSQSYLFGLLLPYQRFVYFLLPPLAILAAVPFSFLVDLAFASYSKHKAGWKRVAWKAVSIVIVVSLAAVLVLRLQTVSERIGEGNTFYASSDLNAYQAGSWIHQNFDPASGGVATQKPGNWFLVYSGTNVIAETDATVDWSFIAHCALDLSYEIMNPLTNVKVYEARSNASEANWVSMNMAWRSATYFSLENAHFYYRDGNNSLQDFPLASLNRSISMDELHSPKRISVTYTSDDFVLTKNLYVQNDTYPVDVTWQVSAINNDLNYASLYLNEYFDSSLTFSKANVADALNWSDPWSNPTKSDPGQWAFTQFTRENLTINNRVDVYDEQSQTAFALQFTDLPASGNIGQLGDGRIDAVRWKYDFFVVKANYTVTIGYQMLTFSMTSYPQLQNPRDMDTLFDLKLSEPFDVLSRNFATVISSNNIAFMVYDVNRFDPRILSSGWVQLAYSNDKYVILTIKTNHPYPYILK